MYLKIFQLLGYKRGSIYNISDEETAASFFMDPVGDPVGCPVGDPIGDPVGDPVVDISWFLSFVLKNNARRPKFKTE